MTREWYVEQLRLIWNARGAADIAKLEVEFSGRVTEQLREAIDALNR